MDERRSVISQNWKHHSQQQTLSTIAISNRWGVIASACAYHRYLPVSHPPLPLVSHLLYTWNAADCGRRTVRISSSRHSTTTAGSVCNSPQLYFDTGAGSVCILPQPYFDTGAGSVCISPQPYFDTGAGSVISRLSSSDGSDSTRRPIRFYRYHSASLSIQYPYHPTLDPLYPNQSCPKHLAPVETPPTPVITVMMATSPQILGGVVTPEASTREGAMTTSG